MAFHVDRTSFGQVFGAIVGQMSIGDQLDIDDIFPLFARRRLVAAIDGQAHVADRHSCLLDGPGLRFAGQITHEKDFVEVHHNWFAPVLDVFHVYTII